MVHRLRRYDVTPVGAMMLLPAVAMMQCLPNHVAKPRIISEASSLSEADIICRQGNHR